MSNRLIELVERLEPARVLLVGDFMLDRYLFGRTERVSPEAPIPVLRFKAEEQRLGGAGFVLAGLSALGAQVDGIGVVGDDASGAAVRAHVERLGQDSGGLICCPGRPTVEKMRLLGSSEDRSHQQMLRLDIEETSPVPAETAERILTAAFERLKGCDVVCIEDYDKGALPVEVCRKLIEAARGRGIPVLIDPARLNDYSKYHGATAIKLNRPEAERATGLRVRSAEECSEAADALLQKLALDAVVITMNDRGSFLATRDGTRQMLSSRPRQVADPTGAGDMVLVTLTMARASGATWIEAVALANVVAGLEVEKLGCVPIQRAEIIQDLLSEHLHQGGKERDLPRLLQELALHRSAGRKIVFTNGCFDLMHLGHIKYFQFAKAQGDVLVVGVNTDAGIRRIKGEKRPIVPETDRIGVLEELESIDYLVRFDEDTPIQLIQSILPDVLVKGADYAKEQVVGWDVVESAGGRVALAPLIDGRSTSNLIRKILQAYGA
jgi:D-beta-D-heptose 7-phosphate kinase/D-beta-D-heptose 1-phosphate adenosyltransferase